MRDEHLDPVLSEAKTTVVWDNPTDHEMPLGERILWRIGIYGPILAVPVLIFAWSPYPPSLTFAHYLSATGCQTATYLGVAPAGVGEPGYHSRLDDDEDGLACEPETERSFSGGGRALFMAPE